MADGQRPLLRLRGIGKSYATPVLRDVDLDLQAGEVHALIGANGAGKSTLANIINGLTMPSSGTMTLAGEPYSPLHKTEAEDRGVHIVQQELNLIEPLSVAENIFLSGLPHWRGLIEFDTLYDRASRALALVDLDDIDPSTPVSRLGVGQRQLVEIASALSRDCRWLILDEPTAALSGPQVDRLFQHVRRLRNSGVGVIYISHRMEEIQQICDRATVLRDGRVVATRDVAGFSLDEAVELMVGDVDPHVPAPKAVASRPTSSLGATALRVENLSCGPAVRDVSFEARYGEILGIAGLVGAGRTELLRAIFGADTAESGAVYVDGSDQPQRFRSPHQAVRAGLAMTPEDRKQDGLLLTKSVRMNATLGRMAPLTRAAAGLNLGWMGWIDRSAERSAAQEYVDATDLKCDSIEQPVEQLSGGNQQKALIARWLMSDAKVYLFDEPTRGVDVSAKATIYRLLHELVSRKKFVVVVSSDLLELMSLCDRIAVMARGKLVSSFERGDWSQERILAASLDGQPQNAG